MIKNAIPYEEIIRTKFYDIWYDPEYEYYFDSDYRFDFNINRDGNAGRDFVSMDSEDNVLGYINYSMDPEIKLAYKLGAINFSKNKLTFGLDLRQVIDDIFMKFGMSTLEFSVICGNPVEKSYDRIVQRLGGKILCIRHNRAKDLYGNIHNDKLYEITREEYLKAAYTKNFKKR